MLVAPASVFSLWSIRWLITRCRTQAIDDMQRDWAASPIKVASLAGVAPAIIIAAQCDVVRDEGERYANALREAGVSVERREYPGMIHGFFGMTLAVDDAANAPRYV